MMKQKEVKWLAAFATMAFLCMGCLISSATGIETKTLGETYPGFSEGILASARLEKMDEPLLLKASGFEITDAFFKETFGNVDPKVKKELKKSMLFLLDQEVMEKLIMADAKSMGIVHAYHISFGGLPF